MLVDRRLELLHLQTPAEYAALLARAAVQLDLSVPIGHTGITSTGIVPMLQLPIPPLAELYVRAFAAHYPPGVAERVRHYALRAQARNSLDGMETWWRLAGACCAKWRVALLPMSVWTAIAIITVMADLNYMLGSIRWMVRTLANAHRYAGAPDPTRDMHFKMVLRGITRELGTQPRNRKVAIRLEMLREMIAHAYQLNSARSFYELVVLDTNWFGAFRSAELVALDIEQTAWPSQENPNEIGLYVAFSKTDQAGQGAVVYLDALPDEPELCPVRMLTAWRNVLGRDEGALFPSFTRTGQPFGERMCPRTVTRIIKKYAKAIGVDPATVASHSERAGLLTDGIVAQIPNDILMDHARQSDLRALFPYFRPGDNRPNLSQALVRGYTPPPQLPLGRRVLRA